MHSKLFLAEDRRKLETDILTFLNGRGAVTLATGTDSPREFAEAIERKITENFESIAGTESCRNIQPARSRRSMEDFAFDDNEGYCYKVDVKTRRRDTKFNMPNLTSVKRLAELYRDDRNYFVIVMIQYEVRPEAEGAKVVAKDAKFIPIEFLDWSCLTIGALGWGQIQIKSSAEATINPGCSRRDWMLKLCERLSKFYPKELAKIEKQRLKYFDEVRESWRIRPE